MKKEITKQNAPEKYSEQSPWLTVSEKPLLTSPYMTFLERDCRAVRYEGGQDVHRFYLLRSRDWSHVIPVTEDGKIVLVRQYRVGISRYTLEVPGGVNDPSDSDPQAAALREMTEETGYVPLPDARCVELGWTFPNPAIQDNQCHSYIVGPVRKDREQKLDPAEMIELVEVPLEDIPAMILRGEIRHALMLNAFFFLTLQSPKGSATLTEQLQRFLATQSSR